MAPSVYRVGSPFVGREVAFPGGAQHTLPSPRKRVRSVTVWKFRILPKCEVCAGQGSVDGTLNLKQEERL